MAGTAIELEALISLIDARASGGSRYVVALAGPPAAGKTTTAQALRDELGDRSAILGLDAFHFDDAILEVRQQRARKGAPFTFDVGGYRRCLQALIEGAGVDIAVPRFDRDLELSRNCAEVVTGSCDILITEGNYLLLDDEPWPTLAPLFDMTVWVDVAMSTVRERILDRWTGYGVSWAEAERRAEDNDLPNAEAVVTRSGPADYVLRGI